MLPSHTAAAAYQLFKAMALAAESASCQTPTTSQYLIAIWLLLVTWK